MWQVRGTDSGTVSRTHKYIEYVQMVPSTHTEDSSIAPFRKSLILAMKSSHAVLDIICVFFFVPFDVECPSVYVQV